MSLPALRLDGYFYERVTLDADPGWPADKSPVTGVNVKVEVGQHTGQPTRWRVIMDVVAQPDQKGQPIPYKIALRCHGFFTVAPREGLKADARTLVQITGASMLYSAARDMVLTLSSRGRFGPVLLPTVSFLRPEGVVPREPHRKGTRTAAKTGRVQAPKSGKRPKKR